MITINILTDIQKILWVVISFVIYSYIIHIPRINIIYIIIRIIPLNIIKKEKNNFDMLLYIYT